jgi:hypothetical protein
MHTKKCNKCNTQKPINRFPLNLNNKMSRSNICLDCLMKQARLEFRAKKDQK